MVVKNRKAPYTQNAKSDFDAPLEEAPFTPLGRSLQVSYCERVAHRDIHVSDRLLDLVFGLAGKFYSPIT